MNKRTFTSARSKAKLEQIGDFARAHESFTSHDVCALLDVENGQACACIRHLAKLNVIHCIVPQYKGVGATLAAVWAIGPGETAVDDAGDDFPRCVTVRQQWAPNHKRSPMDCLLFGVPAAMRERRA